MTRLLTVLLLALAAPAFAEQHMLLSRGALPFETPFWDPGADWSVAATADFTGDGLADLLWRNAVTGEVALAPSQPGYPFYPSYALPPLLVARIGNLDWRPVGGGDYNGDGFADVVMLNVVTGQIIVWELHGATVTNSYLLAYVLPTPPAGEHWTVEVADINGDGKADLSWTSRP